jgi:AraC-like DNA-binding protein
MLVNEKGLWNYKGIRFSRFGNLKQTVIQLIKTSENGLSAAEIGALVGLNPRSFMRQFRDLAEIQREKIEGKYVYFSAIKTKYTIQKEKRETAISKKSLHLPSDSEATLILVDIIKHPDTTIKEIVRRLRRKKIAVNEKIIINLLGFHKITLKKTPDINL